MRCRVILPETKLQVIDNIIVTGKVSMLVTKERLNRFAFLNALKPPF